MKSFKSPKIFLHDPLQKDHHFPLLKWVDEKVSARKHLTLTRAPQVWTSLDWNIPKIPGIVSEGSSPGH